MEITREQFADWKDSPTTMAVMEQIEARKKELSMVICDGHSISDTADETAIRTARLVGNIEGLNQLLNIEFIDGGQDG